MRGCVDNASTKASPAGIECFKRHGRRHKQEVERTRVCQKFLLASAVSSRPARTAGKCISPRWNRKQAGEPIIMLSVGDHDFDTPSQTVEACVNAVTGGFHHYTQFPGIPALRAAMAKVSTRCTGVETEVAEVIATPGGQPRSMPPCRPCRPRQPRHRGFPLLCHLSRHIPGRRRLLHRSRDPGRGRLPAGAAAIEKAVQAEDAPSSSTRRTIRPARSTRNIARRHRRYLPPARSLAALRRGLLDARRPRALSPRSLPGMAERTLVINSMSKSHGMTGWRIGWLTGPRDLIRRAVGLNLVTNYGLNDFVSRAAARSAGERLRRQGDRRDATAARRQGFPEGGRAGSTHRGTRLRRRHVCHARHQRGRAGLTRRSPGASSKTRRSAVMPGSSFGEAAAGHIRISLCQPERHLAEAATRLQRFASGYRRKAA